MSFYKCSRKCFSAMCNLGGVKIFQITKNFYFCIDTKSIPKQNIKFFVKIEENT